MITDVFAIDFPENELRKCWEGKVELLREILFEFPQFANKIQGLIDLTDHVIESGLCEKLYPGTVQDQLNIMPVVDNRINTSRSIKVEISENGNGPIIFSLCTDLNKTKLWEKAAAPQHLTKLFDDNLDHLIP